MPEKLQVLSGISKGEAKTVVPSSQSRGALGQAHDFLDELSWRGWQTNLTMKAARIDGIVQELGVLMGGNQQARRLSLSTDLGEQRFREQDVEVPKNQNVRRSTS